jgi:hypothetical protein
MWRGRRERTVDAMIALARIHLARLGLGLAAAVLCAVALWPSSAQAAGRTQTLRFFAKDVSMTLTTAAGTVVRHPPFPEAKPGDVLDATSLDFAGDHRRHARRWTASTHLRCTFSTTPEPDCVSHVAIGGSLLVFGGNPGTVINGTGRFQGATGRVVRSKEVRGGTDVVARIRLR